MEYHFLGYLIIVFFILSFYELWKKSETVINISDRNVHYVNIYKMDWSKNNLKIKVNDKIIFKNLSGPRVQIVNNYDFIKNSKIMEFYDEYSVIFTKKGEYTFKTPLYKKIPTFKVSVYDY